MRFFVNGFSWEASETPFGREPVTHAEAMHERGLVPPAGRVTAYYLRGDAALSVCDWGEAYSCFIAAQEAGDPARWS